VQRVEARRTETVDALRHDVDRQDILALNLTRAVQLCVDAAGIVIADSDEAAPQTMGRHSMRLRALAPSTTRWRNG